MKHVFFLGFLVLSLASPAHAIPLGSGGGPSTAPNAQAPTKPLIHPRVAKEKATHEKEGEIRWSKVAGAPAASLLLGFGLGQVIQDRLQGYAIAYPVADGLGWLLLASGMGSCRPGSAADCEKKKDRRQTLGLLLLGASRLAQVLDAGIWAHGYWKNGGEPSFAVVPTEEGVLLSAQFRF